MLEFSLYELEQQRLREEKRKDIQTKYTIYNYWTTLIISIAAIIISVISLYFSLIK